MKNNILYSLGFLTMITLLAFNYSMNLNDEKGFISLNSIQLLAVANAEDCNSIDTRAEAYCKNKPSLNCGYCIEKTSGVECRETTSSNKDCYDTGY